MNASHTRKRAALLIGLALIGPSLYGCGSSGPSLGQVEGTVTLDGSPVDGATVCFSPEAGGRSSLAITDDAGKYELEFGAGEPGALVGKHKVTITTFEEGEVDDGGQLVGNVPEEIPSQYNKESTLVKEVVSGSQTIDFKLTSD